MFAPRKEILPAAQQRLWPELHPAIALGFVLYGGTAIALRLGHRTSVDFDFFCERPLDRNAMSAALPFMQRPRSCRTSRTLGAHSYRLALRPSA